MKKIIVILIILALLFYLSGLDLDTLKYFEGKRIQGLNQLALLLAYLGSSSFLIPFNLIFLYIFRKLRFGIILPLATLSSWVLNHLVKELIRRPRPPVSSLAIEKSFSFPSGHAMVSASFILLMAYFIKNQYKRNIDIYAYSYLGLMMLSRVYIGVHYPSDVLVGAALGLVFSKLIIKRSGDYHVSKSN